MNAHPNATAAGITTVPAAGLIWILNLFGIDMPLEVAVGATGGLITFVLWLKGPKRLT